jgi:hypothetical protein
VSDFLIDFRVAVECQYVFDDIQSNGEDVLELDCWSRIRSLSWMACSSEMRRLSCESREAQLYK